MFVNNSVVKFPVPKEPILKTWNDNKLGRIEKMLKEKNVSFDLWNVWLKYVRKSKIHRV